MWAAAWATGEDGRWVWAAGARGACCTVIVGSRCCETGSSLRPRPTLASRWKRPGLFCFAWSAMCSMRLCWAAICFCVMGGKSSSTFGTRAGIDYLVNANASVLVSLGEGQKIVQDLRVAGGTQ